MNIEDFKDTTIVMFGKSRAFSDEEFASQLVQHNITLVREPEEDTKYVLEGRLLTPYERDYFDALYQSGKYDFLELEPFEEALAKSINEDVLLMSLKLSNDKERLMAFIKNRCISDTLFFKLLKMHDFGNEDFFENDANRDVTAALIERFYENIERNHNVQFATTGLIHLVAQTHSSELLAVIAELPPTKKHSELQMLLATHPATPMRVLKRYLSQNDTQIIEAMAKNSELDKELAKEMIAQEYIARLIAQHINLDEEMFMLLKHNASALALNESLTFSMQRELLGLDEPEVLHNLAQNSGVAMEILTEIFHNSEELLQLLVSNPNVDVELLEDAKKDVTLHPNIAKNPSAPQELLQELYELGEHEVIVQLAQNPATPLDILYQLQLDSRYERYVRTNEAFGKHIQKSNIGWITN